MELTDLVEEAVLQKIELARSTDDEKQSQLQRLADFHARHANVFERLMDAVRVCSLGQINTALFEVGGQYRRNM